MPDSRYCAPPGNKSGCVFYRARETHRARPAERITIRERVYRGEGSRGWRVGRRGPLPFPLRLLPAANEYPIALCAVGVHAYTRCPPMPLIARYLPQSIDKRHKIGRMTLSFRKSRNSNHPLDAHGSLHPNANVWSTEQDRTVQLRLCIAARVYDFVRRESRRVVA